MIVNALIKTLITATALASFAAPTMFSAPTARAVQSDLNVKVAVSLPTTNGQHSSSLAALVELAAQRVLTGDQVAAAKFGTDQPIESPAREKAVIDAASAQSGPLGLDPAVAVQHFKDEIAANKVVQYGLFSRWTAHPDLAPTSRPDLSTLRPILDKLTGALLVQLKDTEQVRAGGECKQQLVFAELKVTVKHRLDRLHREALARALTSACV